MRAEPALIAPAVVINYGLSEDWEAVFEGHGQIPLSPQGPTSLNAAGAFLKHVLVPGSLQDKTGPSVATEFGVLLPDSTGNSGVGASLAGIVSQRWDWGTIHLNAETALPATIMAISSSTPLSKGRRHGPFDLSPRFSMRTSLERSRRFQAWSA